ncbi:MAG: aminomethyl-transferring glycine dehydrogenase subunit GcvPB [Alphaproteobacteria bacterium]|nr:aminomethyl-transferring glycine dehydrogenase subunit GcvPB [Alphaproteobacteria bacterium]
MSSAQGRPTAIGESTKKHKVSFTGNRGLQMEEPLIFEVGRPEVSGVDLAEPEPFAMRLNGLERHKPMGLPGLSEPEAMRHYVRLSQKNYSIDAGLYPLGSCTMKHNPRLNEAMARLPGFADVHPLQPQQSVQGALELMQDLSHWLMTLTGMAAVALSPKAGAHGEACGMMAIKAAIAARGEAQTRTVVLVPESAHGTNPATAALIGFTVRPVPAGPDGTVSAKTVAPLLGPDVAKVRPGDLGIDAMHINLHKTFSTPHGGGGPGAGPVVLSQRLASFAPVPFLRAQGDGLQLVEDAQGTQAFGRMTAFHGQMGMFVRALSYILSHGVDGLKQACEDAVLNANYIKACLSDVMSLPFGQRPCLHEALFDDEWLKGSGITTLDFAKAMIDEGYHPMTVYFPLVVHGAMLIEPTESESLASLNLFIATLRELAFAAKNGEVERFTSAPHYAPRRRLDETVAARTPILRWSPPQAQG